MIDIIIPTFRRPDSLERAAKNARENTYSPMNLYFVVEPTDSLSIDKLEELGEKYIISEAPGSHTGAANTAYHKTTEPFFIMANDDFNFHKDWDIPAMAAMEGNSVVGLNDGSGGCVAITLVRRKYIEEQSGCVDIPNTLYFPGYNHNYVDTEFREVAIKRGVWTTAPDSIVEHMHWAFGKAKMDETYDKSNKTSPLDAATFSSRQHLWI